MFGEQQAEALKALVSELIKVGIVTSTDDRAATARVQFEDRDGVVSYNLKVLVKNTRDNKDYWMPDINEQVLCLFLPTGVEQGFILGSYYGRQTTPPTDTKDKRRVTFADDTTVEYDREAHQLLANLGASQIVMNRDKIRLESNGSSIEISASGHRIVGPVEQTGGDMTSDGISAQFHTHGGVVAGNDSTSTPQ